MGLVDDARAAVQRSDQFQGTGAELKELRGALRALIQHAEFLERRLERVQRQTSDVDRRTIGSTMLG